jgi:hypothetical protein
MLTIQQLESTTPNHRHRPSTFKLLAPVTVDISVSMGYSELKMKPYTVNVVCDDGLVLWIQAAGLLTFTVGQFQNKWLLLL